MEADAVRQVRVHVPFNDSASSFDSPNSVLNDVWDLCKYSIKATTFCGIYVDGEGSTHSSLHSNMFMLAFGLVPQDRQATVVSFVKSRGMACSVYGAQYLLEALYLNDEDNCAFELMTAKHDRSWWNMIAVGSTITLEAWDWKYKNNLDWNHAWGAAPANIIPRFLLGVRPLKPGFRRILVQPQPGPLAHAAGTVPTPLGPVRAAITSNSNGRRVLEVNIPEGAAAQIELKPHHKDGPGKSVDNVAPGEHVFVVE